MQDMPYLENTEREDGGTLVTQKRGNSDRYCVDANKYCEGSRNSGITMNLWMVAMIAGLFVFILSCVELYKHN